MEIPQATTTAPVIPRGISREDVRARLLTGFPVTERRLSLNNLSTAMLEGGDGPPIVLLPGPAAHGAQWRHVIPDLVTTHRVIAPDLPGHGASDSIDRPPDREFITGWLSESWITPDDSSEIELAQMWGRVGPCVGIARGELHRVLLESTAGVRMRLGTSVTGLSQHDDKVNVLFTDGSRGMYDLVVGADGIHSGVRRLLVGHIPPRHLGQVS